MEKNDFVILNCMYVNVAMYDSEPTAATSAGPRHSVLSEVT